MNLFVQAVTVQAKKSRNHVNLVTVTDVFKKAKNLSVTIPAGVDTGNQLRLSGEGAAGENGAPAGDLYVVIHVKEHHIFERDGNNLYCEVPISFSMAALGGEIEVPTLDGKVKLKIPAETQTGKLSVCVVKG